MTNLVTDPQTLSSFSRFRKRVRQHAPFVGKVLVSAGFVLVIVYFTRMGLTVQNGLTRELELPDHVIRLEVVNASGDPALLKTVAAILDHHTSPDFEIVVVGERELPRETHATSFLIARDEPLEASKLLGKWLGLDEKAVLLRPIDENAKDVSITLVLGADFRSQHASLLRGSTS